MAISKSIWGNLNKLFGGHVVSFTASCLVESHGSVFWIQDGCLEASEERTHRLKNRGMRRVSERALEGIVLPKAGGAPCWRGREM